MARKRQASQRAVARRHRPFRDMAPRTSSVRATVEEDMLAATVASPAAAHDAASSAKSGCRGLRWGRDPNLG